MLCGELFHLSNLQRLNMFYLFLSRLVIVSMFRLHVNFESLPMSPLGHDSNAIFPRLIDKSGCVLCIVTPAHRLAAKVRTGERPFRPIKLSTAFDAI